MNLDVDPGMTRDRILGAAFVILLIAIIVNAVVNYTQNGAIVKVSNSAQDTAVKAERTANLADRTADTTAVLARKNRRKVKAVAGKQVELTKIIEGSPGAPGAIGLGEQGQPGVGFAGPIGPIGFGTPGTNGVDGVDGAPGIDGIDGEDGAPGADGQDGANGADGADGAPGSPPLSLSFTNPAVPSTCTDPDGDLAYDCPPDP